MSMSTGLRVTAKQKPYPFELSTKELIAHKAQIDDYKEELSTELYESALNYKPNLSLINQQPEIKEYLRAPILEFLLKISIKTRVTNGIFYQAVKIFDRYCSKRVVLRDQVQLVLATCLWLSAKVYGGCSHVINNTNVPPGGRFHGPNPRARIPRLSELVTLCGGSDSSNALYDEGMFVQMERHILDTLNWDVCEPSVNNWLLNFYENNLMQLEQNNHDDTFKAKIEIINIKRFLVEISLFELKLIEVHPAIISQVILNILLKFYPTYTFYSDLIIPTTTTSASTMNHYQNLILDKVLNLSEFLLQQYFKSTGVSEFYQKLITTILKNDSFQSQNSPTSLKLDHSISSNSIVMMKTPQKQPTIGNKISFIPTPPSSRRGSPAGTAMDMKKPYVVGSDFTPPLTPVD